jgi:ADP-ribose pyrophosphatase YjhB (NUDIX family)
MNLKHFEVVLLGVVFDPGKKKILIGKRKTETDIANLTWAFPGRKKVGYEEEVEDTLKKGIKEKTGLEVENLGAILTKTFPEKRNLLAVYFLCEKIRGEEKAGENFVKLKWVAPEELEKHFTTSFHPRLKEYILNLK